MGRPQELMHHELQATAQVEVAKQGLGMLQNTLEVPFTKLGGGDYRYKSSETKPSMPANVLVGVVHKESEQPDPLAEKTYEELLNELPLSLSMELKEENKKPAYQRDGPFLVLEQMLRFLAKSLALLRSCKEIKPEDHIEKLGKNLSAAASALWAWTKNINDFIKILKDMENSAGRDMELATRCAFNRTSLENLVRKVKELLLIQEDDKKYESLLLFAEELRELNHLYDHARMPHAITILGNAVKTLQILLFSFAKTTLSPILCTLGMAADIWQKSKQMPSGIGDHLLTIIEKVSESFQEISRIESYHLRHLVQFLLLLFSGLVVEAAGATKPGKSSRREVVTGKLRQIRTYAYKLAACLISTARVLPSLGETIFTWLSLKENSRKILNAATTFLAMNIPILAGMSGKEAIKGTGFLLAGMNPSLQKSLKELRSALENKEDRKLSIAIREALLALSHRKNSGYFESLTTAAGILEMKLDDLTRESEDVVTFVIMLLESCHRADEQAVLESFVKLAA